MSEKIVLIETKGTMLRYDAVVILRKIADDLAQGKVVNENGETLVGEELKIELKGKLKPKAGGTKGSMKIELSWTTPEA